MNSFTDIISRSDATTLVKFYFNTEFDNNKETNDSIMYFNDQCRRAKLFPDMPRAHWNKIIPRLYQAMSSLNEYIFFKDIPDICDYDDLGIDLPPGENTMYMLHHAIDNYIYKNDIENDNNKTLPKRMNEDLHDCFIEKNICAVCQTFRSGAFYFSTIYGLDIPVCSYCIELDDDTQKEDSVAEEEENYQASVTDEDEYEDEGEDEEASAEDNTCHTDECSCIECKNYTDGWNGGWKAAMKYVRNMTRSSTISPIPPTCANCNLLCGTTIKYCSDNCNNK